MITFLAVDVQDDEIISVQLYDGLMLIGLIEPLDMVKNVVPQRIWFDNEFLAYLCGDNNPAPVINWETCELAPVGVLEWQHRYDPPRNEDWVGKSVEELREFVHSNWFGTHYVWELQKTNEQSGFTLGTWRD